MKLEASCLGGLRCAALTGHAGRARIYRREVLVLPADTCFWLGETSKNPTQSFGSGVLEVLGDTVIRRIFPPIHFRQRNMHETTLLEGAWPRAAP